MKRWVSAAVAALVGALTLAAVAVAAVAPGTYKGHLYTGATKVAAAPATVVVAGTKVTVTVARFPIKCLGPSGGYTQASAPMKYVFKGALKGNKVSGTYINPLGGTGEYFTTKGTFTPATKSFAGTLAFVGHCRGTSAVRAKRA
jgi:hypothetical protein